MGIDGRMRMVLSPYHDKCYDGTAKYDELKRSLTKLAKMDDANTFKWQVGYGANRCLNKVWEDKPNRKFLTIDVFDNRNFWFQLMMVPKLLTPYFWKVSKEELEAKRLELIANDAWVLDNLEKLALQIRGTVYIEEEYDSSAEGKYSYYFCHNRNDENPCGELVNLGDDLAKKFCLRVPDHANAIRHEIECVKHTAKILEMEYGEAPKINKAQYWGLFN